MNLSPRRMSVLLAVQRSGGVVAAADSLHMSPSAVSQHVRLLEKECDARLVDRTPTGAVLTEAGRVLAESAERIESELTEAQRKLASLDGASPTGTVRVGSFATAVRAILLPLIADLEANRPGLDIIIEEVEERAGLSRLRRGELDLLLLERDARALPPAPRGLGDVPILDESWLVVVPPGSAVPTSLADLAGATWIALDPSTAGAFALTRLSGQLGVALTTRHVGYDYDVVLAMAHAGLGYALLPELAVRSSDIPDDVHITRLPGLGARQLVVRHRATRTEPGPAVRAVLSALLEQTIPLGTIMG
ncbi:LysR substrate binding domain protein [Actinomyces sp. Chiba101]|uniref:ModE molybdate transport repressor domain-containing protein n=1 Tax=Actinomyces denticolens TaxID=52767 RepID=A0ABY1I094_9ACTO|nr:MULTISPECIES: LysR family transcriptional regulator [Actinomyces]BAW92643.1 LysR substrate binding domain protein [Actinomyces sp. Chiba101]SHI40529.1 ModE molybdate transport repressor domain-containing protein [Actinomyces denticolens]SUU07862.1 Morphology and auto-aggregation control protein [Actinomyces denticolens]